MESLMILKRNELFNKSYMLQMTRDHRRVITYLNCAWLGSVHDSIAFRNSNLYRYLDDGKREVAAWILFHAPHWALPNSIGQMTHVAHIRPPESVATCDLNNSIQ